MTKLAAFMAMTSSGAVLAGPRDLTETAIAGCVLSVMFILLSVVRGPRRRGVAVVAD